MDKKNILIVCDRYGSSPSGRIVEEYVEGMRNLGLNIRVVAYASKSNESFVELISSYFPLKNKRLISKTLYSRLNKAFIILFRKELDSLFIDTSSSQFRTIHSNSFKPDIILQFVSGGSLSTSFIIASKFKDKFDAKYFIHFFDPIPPLLEWGENKYVVSSTKRMLDPFIYTADKISAISVGMLNVLQGYYSFETGKRDILPIPIHESDFHCDSKQKSGSKSILYLGSIYGKRDIQPFLKAISILSEKDFPSRVRFAGSSLNYDDIISNYPNLKERVDILPWTSDVKTLIQDSDILLDLNASVDFDPFISSKLFTYLGFKKPVLVLCTKTSSAYAFAKDFEAVYPSDNTVDEIIGTLKKIISTHHSFEKRYNQIKPYSKTQLMKSYL